MDYRKLRVIFLGTPEFAACHLEYLLEHKVNIIAVITNRHQAAGRGLKPVPCAVYQSALKYKLPVFQPVRLKDPDFLESVRQLQADVQAVVAFRMLPQVLWKMPPLGTINMHASLLPQYRGAAPIQHVLLNGETMTGVTTFLLQHAIDTGAILLQEKVPITPTDNAGDLHNKLMLAGCELLLRTLQGLAQNTLRPISQDQIKNAQSLKKAPKIKKEDARIVPQRNKQDILCQIRAFAPYPGAYIALPHKSLSLKIFAARALEEQCHPAGSLVKGDKTLKLYCADGALHLLQVQLSGKKVMSVPDLLNGYAHLFAHTMMV